MNKTVTNGSLGILKIGEILDIQREKIKLDLICAIFFTLINRNLGEAAEAAFQLKSNEELNYVASKAGNNRAVQEKVDVYRAQLAQGVPGFSLKGKGFSLG